MDLGGKQKQNKADLPPAGGDVLLYLLKFIDLHMVQKAMHQNDDQTLAYRQEKAGGQVYREDQVKADADTERIGIGHKQEKLFAYAARCHHAEDREMNGQDGKEKVRRLC